MLTRATPLNLAKRAVREIVLMHTVVLAPLLVLLLKRWQHVLLGSHSAPMMLAAYDSVCLVFVFAPSLVGAWSFSRTMQRLDSGRGKKEWTDRDICVAEAWVDSPIPKRTRQLLPWILFGVYLPAGYVFDRVLHWPPSSDFRLSIYGMTATIVLISPKTKLTRLRKRFAPEPPSTPPRQMAAKVHSDFWGVRSVEE